MVDVSYDVKVCEFRERRNGGFFVPLDTNQPVR